MIFLFFYFFNHVCTTLTIEPLIFHIKYFSNKIYYESIEFKFEDALFYFEEFLYIPKEPLCLFFLQIYNNFSTTRYFGFNKIFKFNSRDF